MDEFGIDKTGDVLDSAQAGAMFDELYISSILHPDKIDKEVDKTLAMVREEASKMREKTALVSQDTVLDPLITQRMMNHPLPHWVERMTISYVNASGGAAESKKGRWNITWPNGDQYNNIIFSARDVVRVATDNLFTMKDDIIRNLTINIPGFVPGQTIPIIVASGLPQTVIGFWSLWQIQLKTDNDRVDTVLNTNRTVFSLFIHDDGRHLAPTARSIWEWLLAETPKELQSISGIEAERYYLQSFQAAQEQGMGLYEELLNKNSERIFQDRDRGEYGFAARRRGIERLGLDTVRNHRLVQLDQEQGEWRKQLEEKGKVYPELKALLIARIIGDQEQ
jgi:hypothetical protein